MIKPTSFKCLFKGLNLEVKQKDRQSTIHDKNPHMSKYVKIGQAQCTVDTMVQLWVIVQIPCQFAVSVSLVLRVSFGILQDRDEF